MVSKGGVSPARSFLHGFWAMKTVPNSGWQVSSASLFTGKNQSCKSKPSLAKVSQTYNGKLSTFVLPHLCFPFKVSPPFPPNLLHLPRLDLSHISAAVLYPHIRPESFYPAWQPFLPGAAEQSASWDLAPHSPRLLFNFYLPPPSSWISAKGNVRFGSQVSQKKSYSQSAAGGIKLAY